MSPPKIDYLWTGPSVQLVVELEIITLIAGDVTSNAIFKTFFHFNENAVQNRFRKCVQTMIILFSQQGLN